MNKMISELFISEGNEFVQRALNKALPIVFCVKSTVLLGHALNDKLVKSRWHLLLIFTCDLVPVILDGVVGASYEKFGHLGPTLLWARFKNEENPLFFAGPRVSLKKWIKLVVPPLSALLAWPLRKLFCNIGPAIRTFFANELDEKLVWVWIPRLPAVFCAIHIEAY